MPTTLKPAGRLDLKVHLFVLSSVVIKCNEAVNAKNCYIERSRDTFLVSHMSNPPIPFNNSLPFKVPQPTTTSGMITFFRKIRRQLANENKFLQYSRYAIGEILLVVIGILIALQINNWNEDKKRENQRTALLQNLKKDALITSENMKFLIDIRKDILKKRGLYLQSATIADPTTSLDSLIFYTNRAGDKSVEKWPILTTYEASLSSGEIELLQDRELLQAFNNLQIRNQQRVKMADYHFQSELLFGIQNFKKKFGSTELFFNRPPVVVNDTVYQRRLRKAFYDEETYAVIATEFDIWTNQVNILERIDQINDSILILINRQLNLQHY